MLVPEVKQLWGEDGRCKEPQEEKAAYGQVLHILPRGAAGEKSPQGPTSQIGKLRQEGLQIGGARGSRMGDGPEDRTGLPRWLFLSGPQFLHLENRVTIPILHDQL